MINWSEQIELCEAIAREAHKGQFRRDGKTPYITHCEKLVALVKNVFNSNPFDEYASGICIAWLHDTLEDTSMTVEGLSSRGVAATVIEGVVNMTRRKDETYNEFIMRVKQTNERNLKICDVIINLSDSPTEAQVKKYATALMML